MKILHLIPQLWQGNGAAGVVRNLAEYQIDNQQEVSIIARRSFINYRQHGKNQIGANTSYIKIINNGLKRILSNKEGYRRIFYRILLGCIRAY